MTFFYSKGERDVTEKKREKREKDTKQSNTYVTYRHLFNGRKKILAESLKRFIRSGTRQVTGSFEFFFFKKIVVAPIA